MLCTLQHPTESSGDPRLGGISALSWRERHCTPSLSSQGAEPDWNPGGKRSTFQVRGDTSGNWGLQKQSPEAGQAWGWCVLSSVSGATDSAGVLNQPHPRLPTPVPTFTHKEAPGEERTGWNTRLAADAPFQTRPPPHTYFPSLAPSIHSTDTDTQT